MHLFLDSNIWLSFYHYSSDDLEELLKLGVLIARDQVKLHLPDQVWFEFQRNREVKFVDAISKFKKESLDKSFPQIIRAYEEDYEVLRKTVKEYEQVKSRIVEKLENDYRHQQLKADGIINDLFNKAKWVKVSERALEAARLRMMRGNPPGKDDSHGDAINWECLLEVVPQDEDLYLIAEDKDYRERGSEITFSPFLDSEWRRAKKSRIHYYRRLSSFFAEKYPDIKLATELEKELLIDELGKAPSFKAARSVLRSLTKSNDFTSEQIREIAEAATTNNQVYWIGDDADIKSLMDKLIGKSLDSLDEELRKKYNGYFNKPPDDEMKGSNPDSNEREGNDEEPLF